MPATDASLPEEIERKGEIKETNSSLDKENSSDRKVAAPAEAGIQNILKDISGFRLMPE
jgi:hypothetical protein